MTQCRRLYFLVYRVATKNWATGQR